MVAAVPDEVLKQVIARIPVQRLGTAQEVARVVRFPCEDDAGYIIGAVFDVNGGIEM